MKIKALMREIDSISLNELERRVLRERSEETVYKAGDEVFTSFEAADMFAQYLTKLMDRGQVKVYTTTLDKYSSEEALSLLKKYGGTYEPRDEGYYAPPVFQKAKDLYK